MIFIGTRLRGASSSQFEFCPDCVTNHKIQTDPTSKMEQKHRVVILGGGFGGLAAAQKLKQPQVEITLIDRRNFHLFQPLLYQVATGSLSPGDIAAPLRGALSKQKNTQGLLGERVDIDPHTRRVILHDAASFEYDSLIVATWPQP